MLLGKVLVLLTARRSKEKKENPETNKIKKIGEQTKQNLREVDWTYISTTMAPKQQSEAAKISQKKKKNLMPRFIPSLFIRVFTKQYVVQMKPQSHRRYLPEH